MWFYCKRNRRVHIICERFSLSNINIVVYFTINQNDCIIAHSCWKLYSVKKEPHINMGVWDKTCMCLQNVSPRFNQFSLIFTKFKAFQKKYHSGTWIYHQDIFSTRELRIRKRTNYLSNFATSEYRFNQKDLGRFVTIMNINSLIVFTFLYKTLCPGSSLFVFNPTRIPHLFSLKPL